MSLPLHLSIVKVANKAIGAWMASLPQDQRYDTWIDTGTDRLPAEGAYEGSKKRPDLGIEAMIDGMYKLKWATEVGYGSGFLIRL